MTDWGAPVREVVGALALFSAGMQVAFRYYLARGRRHVIRRKEQALTLTAFLMLAGVGIGNLTHIHAPVTISTMMISAGVLVSLWGLWTLRQVVEANENGHAPALGEE